MPEQLLLPYIEVPGVTFEISLTPPHLSYDELREARRLDGQADKEDE